MIWLVLGMLMALTSCQPKVQSEVSSQKTVDAPADTVAEEVVLGPLTRVTAINFLPGTDHPWMVYTDDSLSVWQYDKVDGRPPFAVGDCIQAKYNVHGDLLSLDKVYCQ